MHIYSITDGSLTITLDQANGALVVGGDLLVGPDVSAQEAAFQTIDGGEVQNATYRNVTQTAELLLIGASAAALQTIARDIEFMLQAARRRQSTRAGARVFFQVQLDGEAGTWRSEILNGALHLNEAALRQWIGKKVEAQLTITRRFFWESATEKELALSSATQSAATGGRTINNAANNWVQIAADQVGGVLPAPVRLVLTNTTGGSVGYRNYYIGVNAFSDPANFSHILEGEARKSGYGTVTSESTDSGGSYNAYSFTNTGLILYDLSSSLLQKTQGRWFRLLARFQAWSGTRLYVKPTIRDDSGLVTLWAGDEVRLAPVYAGTAFVDLGAVPLPPGGYYTSWGAATLGLELRATGAASVGPDFMQLTPMDSYRQLLQRGFFVPNGGTVTDDNIEGITHASGAPIFSPKSGALMVFPKVLQRIHILQDRGDNSTVGHTFSVRAYIRERRLTI